MYDSGGDIDKKLMDREREGKFDFVDAWVELLDKVTDANRELKEASALFVLSSVVRNKAVIPITTYSEYFQ